MKLGAFNILFLDRSFADCATTIRQVGCDAIEIAAGGYTPKSHCNPTELLADGQSFENFGGSSTIRGWRSPRSRAMATPFIRIETSPASTPKTSACVPG
jgi:sugar phosphate isomerase/epimerase